MKTLSSSTELFSSGPVQHHVLQENIVCAGILTFADILSRLQFVDVAPVYAEPFLYLSIDSVRPIRPQKVTLAMCSYFSGQTATRRHVSIIMITVFVALYKDLAY